MKNIIRYLLFATYFIICEIYSYTGNLDNPVTPAPTMYTLIDIYNRISSGTVAGVNSLQPSTTSPVSTGVTLQFIYDSLPGGTTTTALEDYVANGKTFIKRVNGAMTFATGFRNIPGGIPDTGQYRDYTGTPGDGEDGDYNPITSSPSYKMYNYVGGSLVETNDVNLSSVTVDNVTGLMWVTDMYKYSTSSQTWINALSGCEGFTYAGYTDWRLPNIKELISIVDFGTTNAVKINGTYFKNQINDYYWSSTTNLSFTDYAYTVDFSNGEVSYNSKIQKYYVRPVRGGQ